MLSPGTAKERMQCAVREVGSPEVGGRLAQPGFRAVLMGWRGPQAARRHQDPKCGARMGAGQPLRWDSWLEKGILPPPSPLGGGAEPQL